MCFCIKIIVIIDLHHRLLHCQSWWFSLLLLELFIMCSLEHLCVVAVPTAGCFQYVCHLTYIFCSIGVLQLVAATMCVLSAVLTSMLSCFCVLHVCMCWYLPVWSCVYSDNVLNCIHNQILALDTNIFGSVFQFLFLLGSDDIQAFIYTKMLSPESTWNNQGFRQCIQLVYMYFCQADFFIAFTCL